MRRFSDEESFNDEDAHFNPHDRACEMKTVV